MPKKYGVKEKDLVVSHILHLLLTGKLRSGDRVDRNEIALGLGVSRVPIQEALVQLEHDGIVSTRYHRGAFVERFDEATVLEHHELDGLLNGIASARAATNPTPRILGQLDTLMRSLRARMRARSAISPPNIGAPSTTSTPGRGCTRRSAPRKPHPPPVLDDLSGRTRGNTAVLRGRELRDTPPRSRRRAGGLRRPLLPDGPDHACRAGSAQGLHAVRRHRTRGCRPLQVITGGEAISAEASLAL